MDLARLLSEKLVAQAPADTTIIVSDGCLIEGDDFYSDPSLDVAVVRSNHEEADATFVLNEVGLNRPVDNVVVSS